MTLPLPKQSAAAVQRMIDTDRSRRPAPFEIVVNLPDIIVGSVQVEVSWPKPVVGRYSVIAQVQPGAGVLGNLSVAVNPATKGSLGCVLTCRNVSVATISGASVSLTVIPI